MIVLSFIWIVRAILTHLISEGATKIIDGLYGAAIRQKQQNAAVANAVDATGDAASNNPHSKQSSVIYAVFTTPQNAIPGSAVCMFQIDDIIKTFEGL